jgi:hypothetical protein
VADFRDKAVWMVFVQCDHQGMNKALIESLESFIWYFQFSNLFWISWHIHSCPQNNSCMACGGIIKTGLCFQFFIISWSIFVFGSWGAQVNLCTWPDLFLFSQLKCPSIPWTIEQKTINPSIRASAGIPSRGHWS